MAIFAAQPREFDIVIVDPEFIQRLAPAGRLRAIDPESVSWEGYPPVLRDCAPCRVDGQLYGVPLRFGSNGLVFDTTRVSRQEASTYSVLWSRNLRGRIGIWDWYLPSMGVLSLAAGNSVEPYRIDARGLDSLTALLRSLRSRVKSIHATPRDMLASLQTGDTWIVPAGGEWVAGLLRAQGRPVDWVVPREGGIMWMETALIPRDSPQPDLAMRFIRWAQTPEAQALLAVRRAYYGDPCNTNAIPLLPRNVRDVLHVHSDSELVRLVGSLHTRELPQLQDPAVWQGIWERFKADHL